MGTELQAAEEKAPGGSWKLPFFTIWSGQAISLFGSNVVQFALIWWLTVQTGSATVLALASLVGILPMIVLGPIAGAYVDRWDRRKVMIASDALVGVVSLGLAYLFFSGQIQVWHIYLALAVRSVGGGFHWTAFQASTSLMVPNGYLSRVAGMNQTLNGMIGIIAPPIGALLMSVMAFYGIMLLDVGTMILAILPLLFVAVPLPNRIAEGLGGETQSIWVDIREGLRYVRGWPGLMVLIGMAMVVKIALTPAFSLIPLLVNDHFQGGAGELSIVEAAAGIGIVLGGILLSVWGGFKRKIYTVLLGFTLLGVGLVALGLTPGSLFWLAVVSALGIGLTIPIIDGPIMAILQGSVEPEKQGRVMTIMGSLVWLTSPIGLAIAGPVSDWAGLQTWYLFAGLLCVVSGLIAARIPALIHIEDKNVVGAVEL
ncbi:MAG: MFS transporter, partial [Anaerolineales bacterium]|nr:MFS transporter [Anaerolineales bacterium]